MKLSFVLPVALHETGFGPASPKRWRSAPNNGAVLRTRFLLSSFVKNFDQDHLEAFVIICPPRDVAKLMSVLRSITGDYRYTILPESEVCPDIEGTIEPSTKEVNGWRAQQLIKLAAAAHVCSKYYVTLDSDILCIKPFSDNNLVRRGVALTNGERQCDYQRLYTNRFAEVETQTKLMRYARSAEILGHRGPRSSPNIFYGETPVLLHRESVLELAEWLTARFHRPWSRVLAGTDEWTEYSLYYLFLEMTEKIEAVCSVGGCNAVLGLEKSVWHASENYRQPRTYDADHFLSDPDKEIRGPFVAIQSWLPLHSWLPSRFETLNDFYEEVNRWLLVDDSLKRPQKRGDLFMIGTQDFTNRKIKAWDSSPVHFSILQSRSPVAEVLRTKSDARSKQASPGDCGSAETSVSPFSGPRLSKELRKELDVLFFSRGRGKGHAVPDLSIVEQLRKICPDVRLAFASYATGAEVFEAAGESLFRMPLPERNPFADTVLCAAQVLSQVRALLVVSHEEMAVLPAAKIYDSRTVFLSHWFSAPPDPFLHALRFADEVLFMEKPGLFPEPEVVAGRVRYLGPVLRRFYHLPADRGRARQELGFNQDEVVILMLPGNPSEKLAPTCDLVLRAFDLIRRPQKRLVWVAGKDQATVSQAAGTRTNVQVIEVDWKLSRLMVASDAAITKGTYNISRELNALGIPSIALSYGQNFVDDLFARSFPNTTFLWAKEANPASLAGHVETALDRGLAVPDFSLLSGEGAAAVAAGLAENLERAKSQA